MMHSLMAAVLVAAWTVNGSPAIGPGSRPSTPMNDASGGDANQDSGGAQPAGPKVVQDMGAVLRQLRFDGGEGVDDLAEFGWGVSLTFSVKTVGRDRLQGQFIGGEGVARYIEGLGGQNLDAVLTPAGVLTALASRSWMVAYTRVWSSRFRSGVAHSGADLGDHPEPPSTVIERLRDFRVSVIYTPYPLVDVGGEVMWGRRDNKDRTHGDSWRFQFAVIYRLN